LESLAEPDLSKIIPGQQFPQIEQEKPNIKPTVPSTGKAFSVNLDDLLDDMMNVAQVAPPRKVNMQILLLTLFFLSPKSIVLLFLLFF